MTSHVTLSQSHTVRVTKSVVGLCQPPPASLRVLVEFFILLKKNLPSSDSVVLGYRNEELTKLNSLMEKDKCTKVTLYNLENDGHFQLRRKNTFLNLHSKIEFNYIFFV